MALVIHLRHRFVTQESHTETHNLACTCRRLAVGREAGRQIIIQRNPINPNLLWRVEGEENRVFSVLFA
jgi:hypothetical protein